MPPQLVVAAAPYKLYPGGVIAFRATDWLGPARGTLSTEVDTRAIEGEVVRDSQLTASNIRTAESTAIANAGDTLAIDMTGVPIETGFSPSYELWASILIEGDWDPTSLESRRDSSPLRFGYTARMAAGGDSGTPFWPSDRVQVRHYPRNLPHYAFLQFTDDTLFFSAGTETLHIKAFGGPSSTVEWLIDQILLIPAPDFGGNIEKIYGERELTAPPYTPDGADGGDANGKFTWQQHTMDEPYGEDFANDGTGGGDYQKDDSEYMVSIAGSQGFFFEEANAYAYSMHGAYFREAEVYDTDDFTRTVSPGWGNTPTRAYKWTFPLPNNCAFSVDGTRGKMHFTGISPRDNGSGSMTLFGVGEDQFGATDAFLRAEFHTYSGEFTAERTGDPTNPWWDGLTTSVVVRVVFGRNPTDGIHFDPINERWHLELDDENVSGFQDVSSWYSPGDTVGFKIEVRRYRVLCKVWDASGAEPGAWDFDDFRPAYSGALHYAYPYSDLFDRAQLARHNFSPGTSAQGVGYIAQWDVYWDDLKFEFDPYGTIGDVHALMEQPEGTERGRITIPSGAHHLVYWGLRDWTEPDGFGDFNLDFSSKVWSDAGSAALQRAEAYFWWFRKTVEYEIVSMNWREADRSGEATRVLTGGSGR